MKFGLSIDAAHDANHDAATAPTAWFLPGDDAGRWLDELGRCGLADRSVRIHAVGQPAPGAGVCGALILCENPPVGASPLSALPCRFIGTRLCLPAEATLRPPLLPEEADALAGESLLFLHPALGLVELPQREGMDITHLLHRPTQTPCDWHRARIASHPAPGLRRIHLSVPTEEPLFSTEETGSIASKPLEDMPAPPSPPQAGEMEEAGPDSQAPRDEARDPEAPGPDAGDTTPDRELAETAASAAGMSQPPATQDPMAQREAALLELIELLRRDPESGLKHAIPLGGSGHRGKAAPETSLGERVPDFSVNQLGGKAADIWHTAPDLMFRLRTLYRELAKREQVLGRFRRAAYIQAHLLGDLESAAALLKQGRHFREAALIYEERLSNTLEAAFCFAEAGLIDEAARRYEQLGRLKDLAELHERFGNREEADSAWRRWVAEHREQNDPLKAAAVLDSRLHSPGEALAELAGTWPSSPQALACLGERFRLLERLGMHDATRRLLADIRRCRSLPPNTPELLRIVVRQALTHARAEVCDEAADLARVLASRTLAASDSALWQQREILSQLILLRPHDVLLARDANRWLEERRLKASIPDASSAPLDRQARRIAGFNLPPRHHWTEAVAAGPWFFALGRNQLGSTLVRGCWSGEAQALNITGQLAEGDCSLQFEPLPGPAGGVALLQGALPAGPTLELPAVDLLLGKACKVERPSWLPLDPIQSTVSAEGFLVLRRLGKRRILTLHGWDGILIREREFEPSGDEEETGNLPPPGQLSVATGGAVWVGGGVAEILRFDGSTRRITLGAPCSQVLHIHNATCPGLLFCLSESIAWLPDGNGGREPNLVFLDGKHPHPRAAILEDHRLVVADASGGGWIGSVPDAEGVVANRQSLRHRETRVISVTAAGAPGRFALFGSDGQVGIYQAPS